MDISNNVLVVFAKLHMDCGIKNNVTVTFNNFSKLKNKLKNEIKSASDRTQTCPPKGSYSAYTA